LGNTIEKQEYFKQFHLSAVETKFKYNEKGNKIEESFFESKTNYSLTLYIYDSNDNLTQIVFQLNKAERYLPMLSGMQMQQQPNESFNRLMEKMIEGQNLIISKLSADEFADDMENEKPKGFGSILENEQFQQMAIGALGLLINKFAGPAPVTALAGIPNEQKEKSLLAIEILSKKDPNFGDHLLYLANIDDSTYKMLLGFMK
jgi:hypothetical protein